MLKNLICMPENHQGTAVVDGQLKEISIDDYKVRKRQKCGVSSEIWIIAKQCMARWIRSTWCHAQYFILCPLEQGKYLVLFFYPLDFTFGKV